MPYEEIAEQRSVVPTAGTLSGIYSSVDIQNFFDNHSGIRDDEQMILNKITGSVRLATAGFTGKARLVLTGSKGSWSDFEVNGTLSKIESMLDASWNDEYWFKDLGEFKPEGWNGSRWILDKNYSYTPDKEIKELFHREAAGLHEIKLVVYFIDLLTPTTFYWNSFHRVSYNLRKRTLKDLWK